MVHALVCYFEDPRATFILLCSSVPAVVPGQFLSSVERAEHKRTVWTAVACAHVITGRRAVDPGITHEGQATRHDTEGGGGRSGDFERASLR